jgi:hypothetical protein
VITNFSWAAAAERMQAVYARAARAQ